MKYPNRAAAGCGQSACTICDGLINKPLIIKWSLINPDRADLQLYLSSDSYN